MEFCAISDNKRAFLPLLLLGDEQEEMIDRYLDRGTLWALYDGGVLRCVCVVTEEGDGDFEIKNLAVAPGSQRRGYGRAMVEHAARQCRGRRLLAGTGDSPLTVPFYQACGFQEDHRIPNFFTENYDHPIYEAGRRLVDMVVFAMPL
ncbi:GNAT family N-acetyltransferase [uncultured Oscillibacter sp.]|jgi:GNAT superfamily N-acetyltransferase|uniref:GNAT family N-acetyltransferase n=1 Tax=uncultured Oscillibacter sp. TaxID=876091 RepID=UPI0025E099D7|nr:GNAT family N-acetyltransferase [uncultured Oscillibacter sp.]